MDSLDILGLQIIVVCYIVFRRYSKPNESLEAAVDVLILPSPSPPLGDPPPSSAFETLPVEIFEMVLEEWRLDNRPWFIPCYYQRLFQLRQVNRWWRSAVDRAPFLWDWVDSTAINPEMRKLVLVNSRHAKLDIYLNVEPCFGEEVWLELVHDICQVSQRWRALIMNITTPTFGFVAQLLSVEAPQLLVCHVSSHEPDFGSTEYAFELFQGTAVHLQVLHLPCLSVGSSLASFSELDCLDFPGLPSNLCPSSLKDIIRCVREAADTLDSLTIPSTASNDPALHGAALVPITLPKLQLLKIHPSECQALLQLLDLFEAPNASLKLYCEPDRMDLLLTIAQRFGETVKPAKVLYVGDSGEVDLEETRYGHCNGLIVQFQRESDRRLSSSWLEIITPMPLPMWATICEAIFRRISSEARKHIEEINIEHDFLQSSPGWRPPVDLKAYFPRLKLLKMGSAEMVPSTCYWAD